MSDMIKNLIEAKGLVEVLLKDLGLSGRASSALTPQGPAVYVHGDVPGSALPAKIQGVPVLLKGK